VVRVAVVLEQLDRLQLIVRLVLLVLPTQVAVVVLELT